MSADDRKADEAARDRFDPHATPDHADDELLDEILPDHARDLLISRVIDGRASARDWDRFRKLAANEPGIWCELADTQRQHEQICAELAAAVAVADRVALPETLVDDSSKRARGRSVSRWGGWAVAAALIIAWSLSMPGTPESDGAGATDTSQVAGMPGVGLIEGVGGHATPVSQAPDQALQQYLAAGRQSGRVIAEMPEQVVVETTPLPDGSIEVIYLRQIIERRVIEEAYRQVLDESGNRVAVPVRVRGRAIGAF